MRTGNGLDVHRFSELAGSAEFIRLGGVNIPHNRRLLAHSDGDVLLHALCDALLGALALGDIGHHFPDTEPEYAGIDSLSLLARVYESLTFRGWYLLNADMTIVAQAPRMAPYIEAMQSAVANCLDCQQDQISIKATTTEGLGFAGRREGLAVFATVLVSND
ncbi:MAG: 2-C-methyl-D-erythritol 2,4-cyclodiphosphate synthase [Pseudohongiellaceae bacterium]